MTQASDQQIKEAYQSIEKEKGYKFIKIHEKAKDSPEYGRCDVSFLKIPTEYRLDDPKGMALSLKEADAQLLQPVFRLFFSRNDGRGVSYTLERWSKERLMESNDFTEEEVDAITPNRRRLLLCKCLRQTLKRRRRSSERVAKCIECCSQHVCKSKDGILIRTRKV